MTHQQAERLMFEGADRWLFSNPLEPYLRSMERPPELGGWNTSLWRQYIGSWAIEGGRLLLTGVEGTHLNLTRLEGLGGWVGLSGHRPRGRGPVMPHAGYVELPLPEAVPRFPLNWDLNWVTFGDHEVTVGVPAPLAEAWASTPHLEIEIAPAERRPKSYRRKDGRRGLRNVPIEAAELRRLRVGDGVPLDPERGVAFFELREVWIDLPETDRVDWARFAIRGPDLDGDVDWVEHSCCYVDVERRAGWRDLSEMRVYRPDPRPLAIDDFVPGARSPIPATWFSGELRVVDGAQVSYTHSAFDSRYERETFLTIEAGRHTGTRVVRHEAPPHPASRPPSPPSVFTTNRQHDT